MIKTCSKCKVQHQANLDFFYKSKTGTLGLSCYCRDCAKSRAKAWSSANNEKAKSYGALYRALKSEECKSRQKIWYENNKDRVRERNLKRRVANPNYDAKYKAAKKARDPAYRMQCSVASKISQMLSGKVGSMRHLPYSAKELRLHIERQFSDGMSWENYGKWHLDHIRPRAAFKISGKPDCPEFQACWSLTNLRPLWAKDNLTKGAKIVALC